MDCRRVHTLEIGEGLVLAGNIYSDTHGGTAVTLPAGKHRVYLRIRGKAPLQFACTAAPASEQAAVAELHKHRPDIVRGTTLGARGAGRNSLAERVRHAFPSAPHVRRPGARCAALQLLVQVGVVECGPPGLE